MELILLMLVRLLAQLALQDHIVQMELSLIYFALQELIQMLLLQPVLHALLDISKTMLDLIFASLALLELTLPLLVPPLALLALPVTSPTALPVLHALLALQVISVTKVSLLLPAFLAAQCTILVVMDGQHVLHAHMAHTTLNKHKALAQLAPTAQLAVVNQAFKYLNK